MPTQPAIFVIGAGPQIATAVAALQLFVKNGGFAVGLSSRSAENLEKYKALLPEGTKVATAVGDANDPSSCVNLGIHLILDQLNALTNDHATTQALDSLKSALGAPSAVVFNAGSLSLGRQLIQDMTPDDMEAHLRMNVVTGFAVMQWGVKNIVKDSEGRAAILVTGGGLALEPFEGMSGLAAGKAGLLNVAKAFKVEAPHIHVATVIVNGYVDTDGWPDHKSPAIAKDYWELYTQKESEWVYEVMH
ncbi:hypothetical protein AAF712_003760 [Marasmius tenuissimus]|uniref:NAD(P)-binding protein n=1 Tax=Marasmius tenuissimus TaxID=585030 RepID=A0ABR3A6X5_9AGAR